VGSIVIIYALRNRATDQSTRGASVSCLIEKFSRNRAGVTQKDSRHILIFIFNNYTIKFFSMLSIGWQSLPALLSSPTSFMIASARIWSEASRIHSRELPRSHLLLLSSPCWSKAPLYPLHLLCSFLQRPIRMFFLFLMYSLSPLYSLF
jgi:hypothetical protein